VLPSIILEYAPLDGCDAWERKFLPIRTDGSPRTLRGSHWAAPVGLRVLIWSRISARNMLREVLGEGDSERRQVPRQIGWGTAKTEFLWTCRNGLEPSSALADRFFTGLVVGIGAATCMVELFAHQGLQC